MLLVRPSLNRMRHVRRRAAAVAAFVALMGLSGVLATPSQAGAAGGRPSIVLILTDDQRWDTLWALPAVQRLLVARGVQFTNGYVVNPLCCPSRTSLLTGQYSHSTGVYSNNGFSRFDDSSTLATWLSDTGYRTALMGKYLNGYSSAKAGTYIPPGWDRWIAFSRMQKAGGAYFDYQLNIDGQLRDFGTAPSDYSTDVLASKAAHFIHRTAGPLFLYFAPSAPHYPRIPAPRYEDAFSDLAPWRPPGYNEADVSDKPTWVQALPPLSSKTMSMIDQLRLDQYRSLLAVDDAVGTIVQALRQTGRLRNTIIVFTSDNGYAWGEHRWRAKIVPYEESIRVPFVVRYTPLTELSRDDAHPVLNIDIAPTFVKMANTSAPDADGRSLLPLLSGSATRWRRTFLIEHAGKPVPAYCGAHTRAYSYVKYSTDEEELYDLRADPYQLENRAADPGYQSPLDRMRTRLKALCQPPTPGVTP